MHPPTYCSKFNCFYRYKNQLSVGCFFHILPPQPIGLAGSRHCGTKLTSICLSTNTIFPLIIANYPFYRNNTASSSRLWRFLIRSPQSPSLVTCNSILHFLPLFSPLLFWKRIADNSISLQSWSCTSLLFIFRFCWFSFLIYGVWMISESKSLQRMGSVNFPLS